MSELCILLLRLFFILCMYVLARLLVRLWNTGLPIYFCREKERKREWMCVPVMWHLLGPCITLLSWRSIDTPQFVTSADCCWKHAPRQTPICTLRHSISPKYLCTHQFYLYLNKSPSLEIYLWLKQNILNSLDFLIQIFFVTWNLYLKKQQQQQQYWCSLYFNNTCKCVV